MTDTGAPSNLTADLAPELTGDDARVRDAIRDGMPEAFGDLGRLARIPSVSWDGFDQAHVQASAEAVAALMEATGVFDSVRVASAPVPGTDRQGNPAVLARRAARNGAPTVLLYAHHDVQPPGDEALWVSPAYQPTLRGDRLYGRGVADDKAGVVGHVASVRALAAALGPDFDLGLAVFIEGEEEFGSRSFPAFLEQYRDELAADAIIVADAGNWDLETPGLTVALRGNVTFRLTVTTLDHALHSGMFGGAVPDAMLALIKLLGTFHDDQGAVAIEGLTGHEAATPEYDEARLREESGLLDGVEAIGRGPVLERLWYQPTVTVTGIDAPSVMNASNTLQPSVSVRVSARVAPGQSSTDALAAIERHIRAHTPFSARVELTDIDTGDAFEIDDRGPIVAATLDAMRDAWSAAPVRMGSGGSIPFVADLTRVFPQAEILLTGVEDPDSRAHSPNESLHLPSYHRAVLAEALLLARLSLRRASGGASVESGA